MNKLVEIYLKVIFVLFPVLYLPVVTDMYGIGKLWWWVVMAFVGMIIWGVGMVISRKSEINTSKALWVLMSLCLWAGVSWIREPLGVRERALWSVTGVGSLVGLTLWYFLGLQIKAKSDSLLSWMRWSGLVVAVLAVAMFLIPNNKSPIVFPTNNPLIVINVAWSVVGSLLGEVILLGYLALLGIKEVVEKLKRNESYIMAAVSTAMLGLATFLGFYRMSKLGWGMMDLRTAWMIAAESFKNSPLWGVGVGNFGQAFTLFRPASFNLSELWASSINVSPMAGLQIWSEMGVVGLVLIILLIGVVFGLGKRKNWNFDFWMSLGALGAFLLLPLSFMGMLVLVLALVRGSEERKIKLVLPIGEKQFNVLPILVAGSGVLLGIGGLFLSGKEVWAEIYLKNSLVEASKNNGSATYEWQRKLIGINQNMAEYRKIYSQTNLALAKVLLTNKDISEEDKQRVSLLLQQAVREAKAAVALDNYNSSYWTNLALIYKEMIGLVDGAADWSVQAYQQAIMLDPVNPLLKLDYGGLLYAAGKYEEADRVFEQVVSNKNNLANGWYNWAYTAKKMNKLYDAVQRLSQAVALVPVTSGDYDKASKELSEWKKEYDAAVAKLKEGQTQVTTPTPTPTTILKTAEPLPTGTAKMAMPTGDMEPPKE